MIEVIHPGALTTVQDLGRPGLAHLGVPLSGAADRRSLRLANSLVGNAVDAAALETTLVGPRLRFHAATTVALVGAAVSAQRIHNGTDERGVPMNEPIAIEAGDELIVGTAREGLRTYVAVRGGFDVVRVLGSRATDVLTGLGPSPLAAGHRLAVGTAPDLDPRAEADRPTRRLPREAPETSGGSGPARHREPVIRVVIGPREEWFTRAALESLQKGGFEVSPASNRVGIRLRGPLLTRSRDVELPSEGVVPGAIQVPPDGRPIVLLVDHPTTGGYPVIAVALSDDLPILGQLRPGRRIRFSAVAAD